MRKKFIFWLYLIVLILGIFDAGLLFKKYFEKRDMPIENGIAAAGNSPEQISDIEHKSVISSTNVNNFISEDIINIILLGIDRRSKQESSFRTDSMILVSINKKLNKVLLTSVPRDLWYEGQKLNAVYTVSGFGQLSDAFKKVTDLKVEKYIICDFEDFKWIIDAMDGVRVNVQNDFTDESYPVDETMGYQTISFAAGETKMSGLEALAFARSRKGNNGEGSDYARMKRQHYILKGMLESVLQPKSLFNPMNVEKAYHMVTDNRMITNLSIEDAGYLWDLYMDREKYIIDSFVVDTEYLYSPPMEDFGGAWVLIGQSPDYGNVKEKIQEYLYDIKPKITDTSPPN